MPLLRTPWSTPSSNSSTTSSNSARSSLSSSSRRSSTPSAVRISGPMPKRAQLIEVREGQGRPTSQAASVLFSGVVSEGEAGRGGGGGGASVGKRASRAGRGSGASSRRTSDGQGSAGRAEEGADAPLQQVVQPVNVVVHRPQDSGEGKFVSGGVQHVDELRSKVPSSASSRKQRFSLWTLDNVRDLEHAEEGAVLLWMNELAATPKNGSSDYLHLHAHPDERTPELSPSSSTSSSPASRMLATPSPTHRPFTPPHTTETSPPSSVTPKPSRTRLLSPSSSPKSDKTARSRASSSSSGPSSASLPSRIFHPSRWGKGGDRRAPSTITERTEEEEEEEDVFGSPRPPHALNSPPTSFPSASLGRTHPRVNLQPPSPCPPSSSSTPPPFSRSSPSPAVRFASSPPTSSPSPSSHAHTPSDLHDLAEYEFIPSTVPSYSQGQREAPPFVVDGKKKRTLLVRPHPKVRGRRSWKASGRRVPEVPTPEGGGGGSARSRSAASSVSAGRGGAGGGGREEEGVEGCCVSGGG
ncbi:hypothetical protein JCM8547_002925 [Rhodosporidiobolus lusitaniae]